MKLKHPISESRLDPKTTVPKEILEQYPWHWNPMEENHTDADHFMKNNPFKALVDHARQLVDELDERDLQNRLDEDEIRTERMIDDNGQLYWHNE